MNNIANLKEAITCLSEFIEKILEETFVLSDFGDLTQLQLHHLKLLLK